MKSLTISKLQHQQKEEANHDEGHAFSQAPETERSEETSGESHSPWERERESIDGNSRHGRRTSHRGIRL